ncbi:MAG: TetR family transcriptional regulator, partial [Acidimicrobiales bacterium]
GDVAKRAGLSRQTLYKHFASKDVLIEQAVLRESATLVAQILAAEAAAPADDPVASLEAAILATLRLTREHPLLDRLVRTEPEALLPLLIGDVGPVAGAVRGIVEQIVRQRLPELTDVETRRAADVLARLLISYAVSAPDDPPEVVAAFVASVVAHGVAATAEAARPTVAP